MNRADSIHHDHQTKLKGKTMTTTSTIARCPKCSSTHPDFPIGPNDDGSIICLNCGLNYCYHEHELSAPTDPNTVSLIATTSFGEIRLTFDKMAWRHGGLPREREDLKYGVCCLVNGYLLGGRPVDVQDLTYDDED